MSKNRETPIIRAVTYHYGDKTEVHGLCSFDELISLIWDLKEDHTLADMFIDFSSDQKSQS